jgi:glutamate synthase domain-containing protein 3
MGMVGVEALDPDDEARLFALLEEHVARTKSVLGADLLARWPAVRGRFKKVIPTEYKRVLEQQKLAARPSEGARHLKLVQGA